MEETIEDETTVLGRAVETKKVNTMEDGGEMAGE